MGVDYQAAIVVGLPRKEIELEDLQDKIDDGDLEVCPPYYGGDSDEDAIVGHMYKTSPWYAPREFEWDAAQIDKLKADFKATTGKDAKVWISPRGW